MKEAEKREKESKRGVLVGHNCFIKWNEEEEIQKRKFNWLQVDDVNVNCQKWNDINLSNARRKESNFCLGEKWFRSFFFASFSRSHSPECMCLRVSLEYYFLTLRLLNASTVRLFSTFFLFHILVHTILLICRFQ